MARKPRIHFRGAVYHVMLRGNAGQAIFFEREDYLVFEKLVAEGVQRFEHRIHGYCWMPNHVHLLIEVGEIQLSKIIQNLSFRYTGWINKKKNLTGHLFQGRYKAILIDADRYLLELIRYIHLNPVRSGMVASPVHYQWSGHQVYLGRVTCHWLTIDWVLRHFSKKRAIACREYEQFVANEMDQAYHQEFHSGNKDGIILGDEEFIDRLPEFRKTGVNKTKPLLDISDINQRVCQYYQVPESVLMERQRSQLAARLRAKITLLFLDHGGSIYLASRYFGKDISTLSRQLSKLKRKLISDETFGKEIDMLKKHVNAITQA
jgi:REP element-mobilizing transposase RayT